MLSLCAKGAGGYEYYTGLVDEKYYTQGGEPLGQWWGEGAAARGLKGNVTEESLKRLWNGFGPDGTRLVKNAGSENRCCAIDGVFSAPKSLSSLLAVCARTTGQVIRECHEAAVKAALQDYEEHIAGSRIGKGGYEKTKAGLIVALYEHGTSRAQDPNLHTHCLILNAVVRPDGSTGALDASTLFKSKMFLGAQYRAHLTYELETRLGISTERVKSCFEVNGVPKELNAEFSKRREEILEHQEAHGWTSARAAAVAAVETRSKKEILPRETLLERWREVGTRHGFGPEEVQALLGRAPARDTAQEFREAFDAAIQRLSRDKSHFAELDIRRAVAEESQCRGLTANDIRERVNRELTHNQELVGLGRRGDQLHWTTREILALEKSLLATAEASKANARYLISDRALQQVLAERPTLTEEQKEALLHVTRREGAVQCITGNAGTGKTFLLGALREAAELDGFRILGTSTSGKAAQGLEAGAGIKSYTIAKLIGSESLDFRGDLDKGIRDDLAHHARMVGRAALGKSTWANDRVVLDNKTILVVDEAGMVGTRAMERLAREAQRAGTKLVLVGDAKQLQPVGDGGGPFGALCTRLGDAKLTEIIRQRDSWRKESVQEFAQGDAAQALARYAEKGLVQVGKNREETIQKLVREYKQDGLSNQQVKEKAVICGTNLDVAIVNDRIQRERLREGYLGSQHVRVGNSEIWENDRVLMTRNHKGLAVKNGSFGTVEHVDVIREVLHVRLDDGHRLVAVSLKHYDHVKLGYAATTWKLQGTTVETAFVLVSGNQEHREKTYVDASRAKGTTTFFIDRLEAGEKLSEIVKRMSQSRAKDLAHDVLEQQKAQGMEHGLHHHL